MNYEMQTAVRDEMVSAIRIRIANPAEWLYAVRRIAERLDLRVERFLPISGVTLLTACASVLDEASKQGRSPEQVRAAISEWCSYHPAPVDTLDRRNIA